MTTVMPFEDFEHVDLPITHMGTTDRLKYYGHAYKEFEQIESMSTRQAKVGSRSLRMKVQKGALYAWFDSKDQSGNTSYWIRERMDALGKTWEIGKYNRMRFWIYFPEDVYVTTQPGAYEMEVGTYTRRSDLVGDSSPESAGGHFYHRWCNPTPSRWNVCIMDRQPAAQREYSGSAPTGEIGPIIPPNFPADPDEPNPDINYMDSLTSIYFRKTGDDYGKINQDFYIDHIEFYHEEDETLEAETHVFGVSGGYEPNTNTFKIGWATTASEQNDHDIRWSFTDMLGHPTSKEQGWLDAVGTNAVVSRESSGYHNLNYTTSSITVGGNTSVFFAIKSQISANNSDYRQIEIPVSEALLPSLPEGPR